MKTDSKLNKYALSIVIKEGQRHEVRLLAKKTNISVQSLKRIRIGNLRLGNLKEGDFRELSLTERSRIFGS